MYVSSSALADVEVTVAPSSSGSRTRAAYGDPKMPRGEEVRGVMVRNEGARLALRGTAERR